MEKQKRKVCCVITARPSYSRVKTALIAIKNHPDLELQLVIAGSALLGRYGTAVNYIEKDGFQIARRVYTVIEGESTTSMSKTTGLAVLELSTVFDNLKPDIVITIADRFETIATSIAAAYQNIPLAHIQGGEVTGNIDEKVRHANTKLADIHLVASEDARQRVIKLGEDEEYVINTGCPSIDLAKEVLENPALDFDIEKKYGGVGGEIDPTKPYIVVMQHPVTTEFKSSREQVTKTLQAVHELGIQTYWFWPNVDAGSDGTSTGIRAYREKYRPQNIRYIKNMEPTDFLKLLVNSQCLIGNSSVGIRECSYLGVPVVNIGTRQNRRVKGSNVANCDYDKDAIKAAILERIEAKPTLKSEHVYGGGNAGERIAEVLATIPLRFHKTITY